MNKYFINKILNLFKIIKFSIKILSSGAFLKYLYNLKNYQKDSNQNIFIFDNFESLNNTIFRCIYLTHISEILNCKLFYVNYKFNPIFKLIYHRIGSKQLKINLNDKQKDELQELLKNFFLNIKTKKDILNYELDQMNIGMDIYESYLIKFKRPTIEKINIHDNELLLIVSNALKYFIFWRDFVSLNKHRIKGILLSHRNYIETNILNRISIKNQINVYTLTGDGMSIQRWKNTDLNFFKHYKDIFNTLDFEEKKIATSWSKNRLNSRLNGEVGVDMPYSSKSAFNSKSKINEIRDTTKTKILICSSCFFDNPHCYGKMMFEDFYECLKFLGKISHQTDYDWYIKPHPDFLPGTIEILNDCKPFFKNLEIISEHTSFHNLKNKINYAITTYGSIGHELPLLGIPVINCSNINPHQQYEFNFTPRSKTDLEFAIKNLNRIKILNLDEIFEFYYVHHKFFEPTDLVNNNFFENGHYQNTNLIKKINDYCKNKKNIDKISSRIKKFLQYDEFKTSDNKILNKLKKINNKNFNEKIF